MSFDKDALLLYAVTDRSWLNGKSLVWQVEESLKGGVTMVQLREKSLDRESFIREALEINALCRRSGVPFLINDDAGIALESGADGVHVGQEDMEASGVRKLLGADKIVGVTAHSVEQALRAQAAGADYLGLGAVFPTGTKDDASLMDLETVKAICGAVNIPCVAIGGINSGNVMELAGCGLAGVSVVSAIYAQEDIRKAAQTLRETSEKMLRT